VLLNPGNLNVQSSDERDLPRSIVVLCILYDASIKRRLPLVFKTINEKEK
jgi:hypothetical protein